MHSEEMKGQLRELSVKRNITIEQLKEIVYLVFKFTRDKIKSASVDKHFYPSVRIMGIGIFHVTDHRKNKLKEVSDGKQ